MHRDKMKTFASLTAIATLGIAQAAGANMIGSAALSYEETAAGRTGGAAITTFSTLPASDFFGNNLSAASGTVGSPADPGFTFYDDYILTVANSTVDAASFVLNEGTVLAVDNLQMRLYEVDPKNPLPNLSHSPAGLMADWSAPISANGSSTNLGATLLNSGTYILEVRGDVTGTAGGSYAGLIDLQPVPLPAALPLLLSGLGLLGGVVRKRVRS
jgi:hypothetical protein